MTEQSKTPRTDEAAIGFARLMVDTGTPDTPKFEAIEILPADFARTLETENADLRRQMEEFSKKLLPTEYWGKSTEAMLGLIISRYREREFAEERAEQAEAKLAAAQAAGIILQKRIEQLMADNASLKLQIRYGE